MTKKEYNGWYNYETWNVKLWIDNDQGEQEFWAERAEDILFDSQGNANAHFTELELSTNALADALKEHYDENMEELGVPKLNGFYSDLLNAALSEVNWREIAKSMLEDVKEEV